MECIRNDISSLIFLKAMIGTGKTTSIASISEYAKKQRDIYKSNDPNSDIEVIFACSLEPVRHQVGRIAYNGGIKFGIASTDAKNKVRIINHFSTIDDNRILTIADLTSTLIILKKEHERRKLWESELKNLSNDELAKENLKKGLYIIFG